MHGDAQTIKSIIFPRRKDSTTKIEKYLKELESHGLILRYFVNGNQYLCTPNFEKHQPGLRKDRESPSQIPPFTPELVRSNDGVSPAQVKVKDKVKVKEEDKEESSSSSETVLDVYERNLGSASEDMEREIKLASTIYTEPWVIDAVREAVKQDHRTWAYVAGILKNWKRYGKGNMPPKNRGAPNPNKFVSGRYGKYVKR